MTLVKRNNGYGFPAIFDEFLKPDFFGGIQTISGSLPAVNIKETETNFQIELAAPGLKKEDFNLELDHDVLTIWSEVKQDNTEQDEPGKYARKEFSFRAFKRSFTLPDVVNDEQILANYDAGVLKVTLPKKEEALPKTKRSIQIG